MAKKIKTNPDAQTADVMAVIHTTADELGYLFEQHSATSATAHEGGKQVKGNVAATRARLGIELEPGGIKIKSEATGAAYAGNNVPFFTARIAWRYGKFAKQVRQAVQSAGLI